MSKITSIQLRHVEKLLEDRGYHIEISDAAREFLAEVGYDSDYGARPLKRAIQHELQDPLAMKILNEDFHIGDMFVADHDSEG